MKNLEHQIQAGFFAWANRQLKVMPELRWMFAVPNGGMRSLATAGKLKAEGVRAGVLDVCLPVPNKNYIGLWIEFKAGKNMLTANQAEFSEWARLQGHRVEVCYSIDEAIGVVKEYLGKA